MTMSRQSDRQNGGFTLLEMLLVLAILGAVAAVALPRFTRPSAAVKLSSAAREMVGALRLTRSAAIARSTELVLLVDVERRSFGSPPFSERRFPTEIQAQLKVAEPERKSASQGGFRFFPDGSSTGGEVVLSLGERHVRLCVHWLTGQPIVEGVC
jgi:general secretion pathway protein H